jgi:hypothetical protein
MPIFGIEDMSSHIEGQESELNQNLHMGPYCITFQITFEKN